jgi:hypothetical protein
MPLKWSFCEIDVIILESSNETTVINNPFTHVRTFQFMINNNTKDIIIGKLIGINKKININFSLHLIN